MEFLCSKSATITSQAMIKRRNNYEEDHAFPALLYPGDYVLDTKRKRHITGGLLLSGALLFGGLAMTVMSIRDDEEDEDE